jgi:hypothetical protein
VRDHVRQTPSAAIVLWNTEQPLMNVTFVRERMMRKLVFLLICCSANYAWADLPLLYDGFDYGEGLRLAPSDDTTAVPTGQLNVASDKYWHYAGAASNNFVPLVEAGNIYDAATGLPAPTGNSIFLSSTGANGASNRIEIPNMPEGEKTVYWSGFFRVDDVNDLGSAPGLGQNEAGAAIAGFNNSFGAQTSGITAFGGILALKRASVDPSSPLFLSYFAGTASNGQSNDCGLNGSYRCANRHFADYDEAHFTAFPADEPSVYTPATEPTGGAGETVWGARPHFPAKPLDQGETVFLVASYQVVSGADNDVAQLWINPDPETFDDLVPPAADVIATTAADAVPSFCNTTANPACTPNAFAANDLDSAATTTDERETVSFFLRNNGGTGIHSPLDAAFDELRVGLSWGSVTAPMAPPEGQPADYNEDGAVDAADYVYWRKRTPDPTGPALPNDDTDGVGNDDYERWVQNYGEPAAGGGSGAVPEPGAFVLAMFAALAAGACRHRHARVI